LTQFDNSSWLLKLTGSSQVKYCTRSRPIPVRKEGRHSITATRTLQMAKTAQDLSWLSAASRKYLEGSDGVYVSKPSRGFRKQHYFVYGSLMDSKTLTKVLGRAEKPDLLPAKVIGYKTMMWGQYPVLLDKPNNTVYGMTFEVHAPEEVKRLEAYETDHYRNVACVIYLKGDEDEMTGRTFVWKGEQDELKEGEFDLKDWQMKRLELKER
jgi:gamma-glutamylcyclotransferase (GGCT)/AIG2-like uncharacterized protein YtfP